MKVELKVNGKAVTADVPPNTLLVQFIREHLRLTGTHVGCDTAQCGACTVIANGRSIKACNTLVAQMQRADITTIEGVAEPDGTLHPVQAAFKECHGFQCGYCTPGFVNSATVLMEQLRTKPVAANAVEEAVEAALDKHICRCTGYVRYYHAVRDLILATPGLTTGQRTREVSRHG